MKPLTFNGVEYTQKYVEGLRQPLYAIRACLEAQNKISFVASIDEILRILKHYAEEIDEVEE